MSTITARYESLTGMDWNGLVCIGYNRGATISLLSFPDPRHQPSFEHCLLKMTIQESYVPTHPDLFIVEFSPGDFASRLVSLKVCFRLCDSITSVSPYLPVHHHQPFDAEERIADLFPFARAPRAAYNTVQCGPSHEDNIVLNSDLVYGRSIDKEWSREG